MQLFSKKGQVTGSVVTIIVVAVMIVVGLIVTFTVMNSVSRSGWTTEQNDTFDNVSANVNSGFTLSAIIIIAVAAAAILGAFMYFRMK